MIRGENEAIERVLTGLRSTEMPAGMEGRVTAVVKERAAAGEATSRRFRLTRMLLPGGGEGVSRRMAFAAGGVAVVLAAVFTVARLEQRPEREVNRAAKAGAPMQTGIAPAPRGIASEATVSALPTQTAHRVRLMRSWRGRTRGKEESSRVGSRTITSYPAPAAPLSAEEKTLLLVARTGGPQEIAMLDPVARAKRDAEDEAEFERFAGQEAKRDRD